MFFRSQGRIEQHFAKQMSKKVRSKTNFIAKHLSGNLRKPQGNLEKRPGGVELRVVPQMLRDPARHGRQEGILIREKGSTCFIRSRTFRSTTISQSGTPVAAAKYGFSKNGRACAR